MLFGKNFEWLTIEIVLIEDIVNSLVIFLGVVKDMALDIFNASSELCIFLCGITIDYTQASRRFKEQSCRPSSRDSKNEDVQHVRLFEVSLSSSDNGIKGDAKATVVLLHCFQENELPMWFLGLLK